MNTFRTTSKLSKPEGRKRIPETVLAYLQTRSRMHLFRLIHEEFRKSGLSQADLAARLGKGTDRICKLLGTPGNWTSDTATDLVFAITGGVIKYSITYPLDKPKRNDTRPEWVRDEPLPISKAAIIEHKLESKPATRVITANTVHWNAAA